MTVTASLLVALRKTAVRLPDPGRVSRGAQSTLVHGGLTIVWNRNLDVEIGQTHIHEGKAGHDGSN